MSGAILHANALSYGTPDGRVLQRGLSFAVAGGQMLLISGPNGSGKSTLLRALLGQMRPLRGDVRFTAPLERVEYIPQLENTEIHFPVTLGDVLAISLGRPVRWEEVARYSLLEEWQLGQPWNTASGGERKRTLLIRALMRQPRVLIFDEPMNHLDAVSRQEMLRMMARFLGETSAEPRAIVMVCHQGLHDEERELFDVVALRLAAEPGGAA